jgi:hypothetical protein
MLAQIAQMTEARAEHLAYAAAQTHDAGADAPVPVRWG